MNKTLPDYAQVKGWILAEEPFCIRNGLANGAGVVNRQAIAARYFGHVLLCELPA
jgi:hypothetical protein